MFTTYEKYTKVSLQSHDHVTIHESERDAKGTRVIRIRSVDTKRSVRATWDAIGTVNVQRGTVRLFEDSFATRLYATQMEREGFTVFGLQRNWERHNGAIMTLPSDGNVTNPESIMGRIRNRSKHGKRGASFGMRATTDTNAMHEAIKRAQLKRCIAKNGKCICEH